MPVGAGLTHGSPARDPTPTFPHPTSSAGIPTIPYPAGPPDSAAQSTPIAHMRINHRRVQIRLPGQLMQRPDCVAVLQYMRRVRIPDREAGRTFREFRAAPTARCIALCTVEYRQRASAEGARPTPCARARATSSLDPCRPCHTAHQSPGVRHRDPRSVTSDRPRPPVPPSRSVGACRDV